jgi:hypothetical protein
MLRTSIHLLVALIPLSWAAQTENADLTSKLASRATVTKQASESSNLQVSSFDEAVQRKKKSKEDVEEEQSYEEKMKAEFEQLQQASGTVLRGVIHVLGFDVAVYMNRNAVSKTLHKNWFTWKRNKTSPSSGSSRTYWMAEFDMWFKLLHYDVDATAFQSRKKTPWYKAWYKTDVVKKYADFGMKGDLHEIIKAGFVGKLRLQGWWNDFGSHFRLDEMEEKDVSDLSWMHYLGLPWKDLDCRFDSAGSLCVGHLHEDVQAGKARPIVFRLDALDPTYDPTKVWVGRTSLNGVIYDLKLNFETCIPGPDWFQCPLGTRPMALEDSSDSPSSEDDRIEKYTSAADDMGGPWFTYMGMEGQAILKFVSDNKVYKAEIMGTQCLEFNKPCPFVPYQDYEAQFLAQAVILDPGKNAKVVMLFPIYDDYSMIENPNSANIQGMVPHLPSLHPVKLEDESNTKKAKGLVNWFKRNNSKSDARKSEELKKLNKTIMHESALQNLQEELRGCKENSTGSSSLVQAKSEKTEKQRVIGDMQNELDSLKNELVRLRQM